MKNILAKESSVSLANELKLVGISVYEDLHKLLVVDCTNIAYNISLALKKELRKVDNWMVEKDDAVGSPHAWYFL